jgi:hypothetical protein
VPDVPWWGVVSSAAVPVLLVGGGTVAGRLQPPSYDAVADTVSGLAAVGAADRWVMPVTLVLVAVCELLTGLALRPAGAPGRLILMAGAMASDDRKDTFGSVVPPDHIGRKAVLSCHRIT